MGLFNSVFGRGRPPVLTVTREPQPAPEGVDTPDRKTRLFIQCLRVIEGHPLASMRSRRPIGDGCGLEELCARIEPVFATDESLIPWVALRGAMTLLYQDAWRQGGATPFVPTVELVMGVGHTGDIAKGDPTIGIAPEFSHQLTPGQEEAVFGVHGAVWRRLLAYEEYSRMSTTDVKRTDLYPSRAIALDIIAWVSVALCRLGSQADLVRSFPKPDLLEEPGWYTEPLFRKAERYWNGRDWTDRCRSQGREVSVPL